MSFQTVWTCDECDVTEQGKGLPDTWGAVVISWKEDGVVQREDRHLCQVCLDLSLAVREWEPQK